MNHIQKISIIQGDSYFDAPNAIMLFSYGGSKFESPRISRLMKKILKSGRYDPRIGEISDTKIYIIEKHSKIIQNLN